MIVRKVLAYITRGDELLVFTHPASPEAGIQVPGGTIEDGESPEAAVLREAFEETGLPGLRLVRFLGEQVREMVEANQGETHHRYFFHLAVDSAPDRWRSYETFGGGDPIPFDMFFVPIRAVPALITDHDHFVSALDPFDGAGAL